MPSFQFDSFADFVAMGGDGFFVWVSYAFFIVFICWSIYFPKLRRKQILKLIRARKQRENAMNKEVSQ